MLVLSVCNYEDLFNLEEVIFPSVNFILYSGLGVSNKKPFEFQFPFHLEGQPRYISSFLGLRYYSCLILRICMYYDFNYHKWKGDRNCNKEYMYMHWLWISSFDWPISCILTQRRAWLYFKDARQFCLYIAIAMHMYSLTISLIIRAYSYLFN